MITKATTARSEVAHVAVVSRTRLTDAEALKQLTASGRRFVTMRKMRRCPYLPNCWHDPKVQAKAECKRSCRAVMIRRARRGEL